MEINFWLCSLPDLSSWTALTARPLVKQSCCDEDVTGAVVLAGWPRFSQRHSDTDPHALLSHLCFGDALCALAEVMLVSFCVPAQQVTCFLQRACHRGGNVRCSPQFSGFELCGGKSFYSLLTSLGQVWFSCLGTQWNMQLIWDTCRPGSTGSLWVQCSPWSSAKRSVQVYNRDHNCYMFILF